jgi:hypothetical protein
MSSREQPAAIRHYLVVRGEHPVVYDFGTDQDEALMQYGHAEYMGWDCLLLGADSVDTLRVTHGSWVTPDVEVRSV